MAPGAIREPFNLDVWIAGTNDRLTSFRAPVHLIAWYQDADVADTNEDKLGLACFDTELQQWRLVDNVSVDSGANIILGWLYGLVGTRHAIVDTAQFAAHPPSTASPVATATFTVEPEPTYTPTMTASPTPSPTDTPAPVPSPTPTATRIPTAPPSPTPLPPAQPAGVGTAAASPPSAATPPAPETPAGPEPGARQPLGSVLMWAVLLLIALAASVIAWWALSRRARRRTP